MYKSSIPCREDMLLTTTSSALPDGSVTGCGDGREQSAERPERCFSREENRQKKRVLSGIALRGGRGARTPVKTVVLLSEVLKTLSSLILAHACLLLPFLKYW